MWVRLLLNALADGGKHFLLAAGAGSAAFCLTLTISFALRWGWERSTRNSTSTGVGYCILCLCLLAGLSAALWSHAWLDGFAHWYVTPLGERLQIVW